MGKLNENQSGFSVIEAVLILVILGIVSFTGYFVWHAKQNTDKSLTPTNSTTPVVKKKTTTATTQTNAANQNIVKVTALGVQITVPDSIKDITIGDPTTGYLRDGSSVTSVGFSTKTLVAAIPSCTVAFPELAKGSGTYSSSTFPKSKLIKQYSSFYIAEGYAEGPCDDPGGSTSAQDDALLTAQSAVFDSSLASMALIQ